MKKKNLIADLVKALKSDREYRRSWEANIAMGFKDCYYKYQRFNGKKYLSHFDIHGISNKAASDFIDALCRKKGG